MKTKTHVSRIDLPTSIEELLRGLNDLRDDPELVAAERQVGVATEALGRAKNDLQRLDSEARALPDAITRGHAAPVQLDAALVAVRRAAALIPAAEQALSKAEAERDRATEAAKDRALQLVNERFERLLKADEIVVAQMDTIDAMMDALTYRLHDLCFDPATASSGKYDQRGRTGAWPERSRALIRRANSS